MAWAMPAATMRLVAMRDRPPQREGSGFDPVEAGWLKADRAARRSAPIKRKGPSRPSVTPYDAVYVSFAEALDVTLVTADARLARAPPGIRCEKETIGEAESG